MNPLSLDSLNLDERINFVFEKPHCLASRTLYKVNKGHFTEVWYMPDGSGIHKVDFVIKPKLETDVSDLTPSRI